RFAEPTRPEERFCPLTANHEVSGKTTRPPEAGGQPCGGQLHRIRRRNCERRNDFLAGQLIADLVQGRSSQPRLLVSSRGSERLEEYVVEAALGLDTHEQGEPAARGTEDLSLLHVAPERIESAQGSPRG